MRATLLISIAVVLQIHSSRAQHWSRGFNPQGKRSAPPMSSPKKPPQNRVPRFDNKIAQMQYFPYMKSISREQKLQEMVQKFSRMEDVMFQMFAAEIDELESEFTREMMT